MKTDRRAVVMEPPARPQRRWEYRHAIMDRAADLSQFGAEGWECYAVVPAPADMALFYFRRPL